MNYTKKEISPNDFDVKNRIYDSPFHNSEKETIARNLIILSQLNNNQWLRFTWDEYVSRCTHKVTISEKVILDNFVENQLLSNNDGIYSIEDGFIFVLKEFVIKQS